MKLDLRYLQILFLGAFLTYGIHILGWDITPTQVFKLVFTALLTQSLFCLSFGIPINTVKSAVISALAIGLLLRSSFDFIFVLAGFFAVSSKYIFRFRGKHFFNPANFALIVLILTTGLAWIPNDQWSFGLVISFVILSLIIRRGSEVKKFDLSFGFILFYFGIMSICNLNNPEGFSIFFRPILCNGAFILFTFFHITDPASTPNCKWGRIFWVFLLALVTVFLGRYVGAAVAPFYGLFILSPVVPLIDYWIRDGSFSWDSIQSKELYTNAPLASI